MEWWGWIIVGISLAVAVVAVLSARSRAKQVDGLGATATKLATEELAEERREAQEALDSKRSELEAEIEIVLDTTQEQTNAAYDPGVDILGRRR